MGTHLAGIKRSGLICTSLLILILVSRTHLVANVSATRPGPSWWNILLSSPPVGTSNKAEVRSTLSYYVHVGLNNVNMGILIHPINISYTNNFGNTQLFAFNVTQTTDPLSTKLGYIRGYMVMASYDTSIHGVEVALLQYDDGQKSGTVQIQGLIIGGTNEVAIVGGTGDFRGASGYGIVTQVDATSSLVLYQHTLYFL